MRAGGLAAASSLIVPRRALAFGHGTNLPTLQSSYVAQSFGIFLHFNMSTFENVELASGTANPNDFNPSSLSIDQWITNITTAKAKYACLTAKHRDGFCLWPTATTTHSIVSSSPFYANSGSLDIASSFITKCRAASLAPVLYFSNRDTSFEANNPGFTQAAYKAYLKAQLAELLVNYGPLTAIWTDDTEWDNSGAPWTGTSYPWATPAEYLNFVRSYQPGIMLINNSHTGNLSDSHIVEFEADTGNGTPPSNNTFPAECCQTSRSDNNWFWKTTFSAAKSSATLISNLITFNSYGSSYLLNCPPDTTGNIPSETVTLMAAMGAR